MRFCNVQGGMQDVCICCVRLGTTSSKMYSPTIRTSLISVVCYELQLSFAVSVCGGKLEQRQSIIAQPESGIPFLQQEGGVQSQQNNLFPRDTRAFQHMLRCKKCGLMYLRLIFVVCTITHTKYVPVPKEGMQCIKM